MTGAHFDPAHPAFILYERDERILVGLLLLAFVPFALAGLAIALWKRARGEGWRVSPGWCRWPR